MILPVLPIILGVMVGISWIIFKTWQKTRYHLHLMGIPSAALIISSIIFLVTRDSVILDDGFLFFFVLSLGLPPMVAWGEEFTRRMQRIASTGDFELGLPSPSEDYQLLGAMGQLIQELAKPVVALRGPEKINQKISEFAKTEPAFKYMREDRNGRFQVDQRILPIFEISPAMKAKLLKLVDFLVQENANIADSMPASEFEEMLETRTSKVIGKYRQLLIKYGILDCIAKGIFSDSVSSGLIHFDVASGGGYPRHSTILICGPPSDERNLILNSFIGTGLAKKHSCLYVTSAQPPAGIKRQLGKLSDHLTIVDCYTNRIEEVSTITREGNVITSPIEMSVVSVAISRGMDKEDGKVKRAVVDILPTYLVFQSVEKIYLDLMEIIDDLRKNGYTVLFSLNPYYIKDEGAISTLEELFDGIIHVERTADSSGIRNEIKLRVEKMAGQHLSRSVFSIQLSGKPVWTNEQETEAETAVFPDTASVEA